MFHQNMLTKAIGTGQVNHHNEVMGGLEEKVPGIGRLGKHTGTITCKKRTELSIMQMVTTQGDMLTAT